MAELAAAPEGKMYSISEGKYIDKPTEIVAEEQRVAALKTAANTPDPDTEEEEEEEAGGEEEKKPTDEEKAKIAAATKKTEDEKKKAEANLNPAQKLEAEKKAKEEEAKEAAETKKKEEEAGKSTDFEPFLKQTYGEKYGIEKQSDLDEILENTQKVVDDLEAERKKSKEPVYRSEQEKKIAEFLKPWPLDKLGEGMQSVAAIIQMDIPNISDKKAMEESYILEHADLTREEAKELFEDEYSERYTINKDDFDTPEAYEKKKRLIDIKIKDKAASDKKMLLKKQEELKAKPEEKKPEQETFKIPEKTISEYQKQIDKFFDGDKPGQEFSGFVFQDDDNKDLNYKITFDADKLKTIREIAKEHIRLPGSYDKSGKIPNFDPAEMTRGLAKLIYSDWYDEQHFLNAKNLARVMKAEQIAGKKPDKVSKSAGKTSGMSIIEQFGDLAKREKEKKKR